MIPISSLEKLFLLGLRNLLQMYHSIYAITLPQCLGLFLTRACNKDRTICEPTKNR